MCREQPTLSMCHRAIFHNRDRNTGYNNNSMHSCGEATVTATTTHTNPNRLCTYSQAYFTGHTILSFARAVRNFVVSFRRTELLWVSHKNSSCAYKDNPVQKQRKFFPFFARAKLNRKREERKKRRFGRCTFHEKIEIKLLNVKNIENVCGIAKLENIVNRLA